MLDIERRIPLTNSTKTARIDAEDYDKVSRFNWQLHSAGYAYRCDKGEAVLLHRFVYPTIHSKLDHENHDKLDCRKKNLRPASSSQNATHRKGKPKAKSGYFGVYPCSFKTRKPWYSRIRIGRASKFLGTFQTRLQAAFAYDSAARFFHGKFATLNFPHSC